jgi:ribosome-associated protein
MTHDPLKISKTQRKKDYKSVQSLCVHLCDLSKKKRESINLPTQVLDTVLLINQTRSGAAKKRLYQFMAKQLRNFDLEQITQSFDELDKETKKNIQKFKSIELLRDQLIEQGQPFIQEVLNQYPHASRQQLRTYVRKIQDENTSEIELTTSKKKLFSYLRSLNESQ